MGGLLRLAGAKYGVLPTASRSLWALPLSLTRAERGGEPERRGQRKQTGQRLQCVSGQRGVPECSPPLFSTARNSWRVICCWRCHLSSARRRRATSTAGAADTHTQTHTQTHTHTEQMCRGTSVGMSVDGAKHESTSLLMHPKHDTHTHVLVHPSEHICLTVATCSRTKCTQTLCTSIKQTHRKVKVKGRQSEIPARQAKL